MGDEKNENTNDSVKNENNYEVVSASELIQQTIDSYKSDKEKEKHLASSYDDVELNNDPNPIVIKKKNDENIVYKQNVFIRWLQPPTPPPPAPIISKCSLLK